MSVVGSFETRVRPWMLECFGAEIAGDKIERNHRFLEESLELVQAAGCTKAEALTLVDYVFARPVGELAQEVGGVMVTLAALCLAQSLDMHAEGERELARIWSKIEVIRAKQAAKPKHSPLPQAYAGELDPLELASKAEGLARGLEELHRRIVSGEALSTGFVSRDLESVVAMLRAAYPRPAPPAPFFVGVKDGRPVVQDVGDEAGDAKSVELYVEAEDACARYHNVRRARLFVEPDPVRAPESWGAIDG